MHYQSMTRRGASLLAALTLALLAGCATVAHPNPADPFESYNRTMTKVNENVDRAVIKPVATLYKDATPQIVRTGVTNFFNNVGDLRSMFNSALQGNPQATLTSFWRVAINSTLGFGGLLDWATPMHLQRSPQDFGLTLGHWGFGPGPYLVLPLLGPSSVRDTAGLPVDWFTYATHYIQNGTVRYVTAGVRLVNARANLLGTLTLLNQAALDPYTFTRDAYLQRRESLIRGNDATPPDEERYDLDEDAQPGAPAPAPAAQ